MVRVLVAIAVLVLVGAFVYGQIDFWLLAGLFACVAAIAALHRQLRFWRGNTAHATALVHLDSQMAVRPTILGASPPDGYRLSCLYFGSGLIDRTRTLDHGFAYEVLDPLPAQRQHVEIFADLCDRRALEIVALARRRNCAIHMMWSGGIDSTTACVALIRALRDQPDMLRVYLNSASRREYPKFFKQHLKGKYELKRLSHVGDAYASGNLVVTGELGDQVFGSAKALEIPVRSLWRPMAEPFPGPLRSPWREALADLLRKRLASTKRADCVIDYLSPQIERAPVAVDDLFTCLWWMNFSMKWQPVSLRMMAGVRGLSLMQFRQNTAHFFQTEDFQCWAMAHAGQGVRDGWSTYKWASRDYIHTHTRDEKYVAEKQKLPSLRGLVRPDMASAAFAIDASGERLWQYRDHRLRSPMEMEMGSGSDSGGITVEFSARREDPLWNDLSGSE